MSSTDEGADEETYKRKMGTASRRMGLLNGEETVGTFYPRQKSKRVADG